MRQRVRPVHGVCWVVLMTAAVIAPLCLCGEASAGRFLQKTIRMEGEIKGFRACDVAAGGGDEVVVSLCVHGEGDPQRYLKTYQVTENLGPSQPPRLVSDWEASPDAVFWFAAPAGRGDGLGEYFLTDTGLWELCAGEGGQLVPRQRIEEPLFVSTGMEDELLWLDAVRDWDGDGVSEVLLPLARQARFYESEGQGAWKETDAVPIAPFSAYNNNIVFGRDAGGYQYLSILLFPLVEPADMNGDGRMDLLVLQMGKVHCYFRGSDGRLAAKGVTWNVDIRTPEEKAKRRATLTFRVADLNKDGCADIIVHKVGMDFTEWSSETAIYLGNREGKLPEKPSQRFQTGGLLSGVSLQDLDGNGYDDMIIWSIRMGLWPIVDILVRKVVHLESAYYYPTWPQGFPEKPASRMSHEFRIDMKQQHFFKGLVPNSDGDFNGDGIKDLVAGKDMETGGIYLGRPGEGFASRSWATIKTAGVNYVMTGDLDGNGLCDIYGYRVDGKDCEMLLWLQQPETVK